MDTIGLTRKVDEQRVKRRKGKIGRYRKVIKSKHNTSRQKKGEAQEDIGASTGSHGNRQPQQHIKKRLKKMRRLGGHIKIEQWMFNW